MSERNHNLDGQVIPPADYEIPRSERRPDKCDGDGCMLGVVLTGVLGMVVGFVGGLWAAGVMG